MPVKCEEWRSLLRDDACNVVDVCIKLQMQSVSTISDKHGTETTSPAIKLAAIEWVFSSVKTATAVCLWQAGSHLADLYALKFEYDWVW